MNRYITLEGNMIISERIENFNVDEEGKEIVLEPTPRDGEVYDDGTYGLVGQELIDGIWKYNRPAPLSLKRFIRIDNNAIIGERFAKIICEGEVECDGTYGAVGSELINGEWVMPVVEHKPTPAEESQATQAMALLDLMERVVLLEGGI